MHAVFFFLDLSSCSPAFQREPGQNHNSLLILQCDSGHLDGDLIACARYRIYDERAKTLMQNNVLERKSSTHVLFIIHLPQQATGSSFVGFQGDPWISTHIDDLRPADGTLPTLDEAIGATISELFLGHPIYTEVQDDPQDMEVSKVNDYDGEGKEMSLSEGQWVPMPEDEEVSLAPEAMVTDGPTEQQVPPEILRDSEDEETSLSEGQWVLPPENHQDEEASSEPEAMVTEGPTEQGQLEVPSPKVASIGRGGYFCRLHGCIHASASKLQDSEKNKKRGTKRVEILMELIPKEPSLPLGEFGIL